MSAKNDTEDTEGLLWDIGNPHAPINVIWVHTMYEDIIRNPNLIPEEPMKSNSYVCPYLTIEYYLEIKKCSRFITITCKRKLLSSSLKPDEGYFLRFYFSVTGVEMETKTACMMWYENFASVRYLISKFSAPPSEENQISTIKCVIRMIEISILPGAYLDELEEDIQLLAKDFSKSQSRNMAYLLKRSKFKNIYTSREVPDGISLKVIYIRRAYPHSKEISAYIKAKEIPGSKFPELSLGEILCYLHCGERNKIISEEESLTLFINSYRIGLHFLFEMVSDYILDNLNNDYVIDVLKVADAVSDRKVFKAASVFFLENRDDIFQSAKWRAHIESSNAYARSILHNIKIEQLLEDPFIPPGLFDETTDITMYFS